MARTNIKFEGVAEMSATLRGLGDDLRNEILRDAIDAGALPIVEAVKRMAPVATGALRESINHVTRRNKRDGSAYAIIGPDRGSYLNGAKMGKKTGRFGSILGADKPSKYAHLVEYGHAKAAHGSNLKKGIGHTSGFVAAKPFLRPGVMMASEAAAGAIADAVDAGISRAISKRVKSAA